MIAPLQDPITVADVARLQSTHWVKRLVRCVRVLGLRRGWRYWRIENWAIKDPSRVLAWAYCCERESKASALEDPAWSKAVGEWAVLLRKHHAIYTANDKLTDSRAENQK